MTKETFKAPLYDGETIEQHRFTLTVRIEHDCDHGAPWDNEDGHGPVTDWTSRAKAPGELILCSDRGSHRFYDFAEACRIALRDQWGFLPGKLVTKRNRGGWWRATVEGSTLASGPYRDINAAIREVCTKHQATMSPRAYAAKAALHDFEYLRRWCNDGWSYVGVIVTASREGIDLGTASLWGIASDDAEFIAEMANNLASEAIAAARETLERIS